MYVVFLDECKNKTILWFQQLTIEARDKGVPPHTSSSSARLSVRVARNQNEPVFRDAPYSADITRDTEVGTVIKTVAAVDNDEKEPYNQVYFMIIGDDNSDTYFEVTETGGELKVKRSLNDDSSEVYKVCCRVGQYFEFILELSSP